MAAKSFHSATLRQIAIVTCLATTLSAFSNMESALGFQSTNDLTTMRYRNPADGDRLINGVSQSLSQVAFRASILAMRVKDVKPPHKVTVIFTLRERLAKPELQRISEAVRTAAGAGFKNYFVRFLIEGQNFSGYWAEADHKPDLAVRVIGLTGEAWDGFVERAKAYRPEKGEAILAQALIGGYLARQVVLVRKGKSVTERVIMAESGKISTEKPLTKRGGRYWFPDRSLKENYRIRPDRLELHDKDGLIRAYNRSR